MHKIILRTHIQYNHFIIVILTNAYYLILVSEFFGHEKFIKKLQKCNHIMLEKIQNTH